MSDARRGCGWLVAGLVAGVIGPVAFTGAWVIASLRQHGHPVAQVQISGLAAPGARDPWIMIAGFVLLGLSLIVFGSALGGELGGRRAGPGPLVIEVTGVLTIAAGLLRRDHMLLTSGPQSWHNRAHNVVSGALYIVLIVAPLLLAWRLRAEARWRCLPGLLTGAAAAAAAVLAIFAGGAARAWDGTLQRIGVSIPLVALVAVAVAMLRARRLNTPSPRQADASSHEAGSSGVITARPQATARTQGRRHVFPRRRGGEGHELADRLDPGTRPP
jgi:hypothetical protein